MLEIDTQYLYFASFGTLIILAVLAFIIMNKAEHVRKLQVRIAKLHKSFNDLDQQAKLIVKTDLELNKAQEELDKRVSSLDALQKTSRLISTTLDEGEIFTRLSQAALMTELGFERVIIALFDAKRELKPHVNLGFSENDVKVILGEVSRDTALVSQLEDGHSIDSFSAPKAKKHAISQLFGAAHFVLSPIITQNGVVGTVFVGNRSNAAAITDGDEELVSILAIQIGQSLENARLFEEVFKSSQALELKVSQRTQQLADALEEVKDISRHKSEFVSAVSHELRTPLTSIKGFAALLIAGKLGEIPEKVKDRLIKINYQSDNLVKLINDLLDISRIESGRVEMSMLKCDIVRIAENVSDLLIPQMKEKNITFVGKYAPDIPEIVIDSSQIERVFINLVGNAVKFTPENGTISITITNDDKQISAEVHDTGIGISEDDIKKLFNEFYRVENKINQNVKGTGLGLPLAKKIVEAHNGKMWITSKLNEGTTFHFTIPFNNKESVTSQVLT